MDTSRIAKLRRHVAELRELAALISDKAHRNLLLESATEFEKLAETLIRQLTLKH